MVYFNDLCPFFMCIAFVTSVGEYIKKKLWTLPSHVYIQSTIKLV